MSEGLLRLLLVEDDDNHAELLMRCLRKVQIDNLVDRVCDGSEALINLKDEARPIPDLILLDLKLPKLDGHEVLRFIRGDARLKDIPVIVLTTSDAECDRMMAYELKVKSYLVKPLEYGHYKKIIDDLTNFLRHQKAPGC